jgi:hypothetical protein
LFREDPMKSLTLFATALLLASPAIAQQTSNGAGGAVRSGGAVPEGSSEPGVTGSGERKICRRVESTGSRSTTRRVCKTAAEWRAYDSSTRVY